jgi:hypothetical protein
MNDSSRNFQQYIVLCSIAYGQKTAFLFLYLLSLTMSEQEYIYQLKTQLDQYTESNVEKCRRDRADDSPKAGDFGVGGL